MTHSMWWGIVARFTLIIVAGYLAALLIRVPIWVVVGGPYWGAWWPLPVHLLTGIAVGYRFGPWALGARWWKQHGHI